MWSGLVWPGHDNMNLPPRQARGRERSFLGARGVCVACGARGNHEDGDGENHQESVMGGGANALGVNVGGVRGAPPTVFMA
ncbi:hypothetical protein Acr_18g0009380 [Actinidia rufa]|uniref:Uncharacterized protein n=1 Tax=Actinidia rufa TaxID=165716 RepID=A0A7J0G7T4_9ERIC|nr:hypothetical protein Acr_18g0009380 [Actinidia rufa]